MNGPTDTSGSGEEPAEALAPADGEVRRYLEGRQEEMRLAERLKDRYEKAVAESVEWTAEMQMQCEEELRRFVRERQEKEVAAKAEQTVNPFQPSDAHLSPTGHGGEDFVISGDVHATMCASGAVAASSWAMDSRLEQSRQADRESPPVEELTTQARLEEENLRYSFNRPSTFEAEHGAEDGHVPTAVDGLQTVSTVNRFVSEAREANEDEDDGLVGGDESDALKGMDKSSEDFDSIFQKFVSNPE
ncbi:hypothetical protein STCU_06911 [Strigomonas culicis]|uniref:Uncharacterized protein n=1 Tax=Strigomonas culicis TaxID=28005 RepID=S9U838_9TRYP|nr:hypothetical protein STCU_06911 [Strigomonas culicis]|eukprot:EPY24974.1 hypothetical protein STCU_06911 [Strigomonas culicis]